MTRPTPFLHQASCVAINGRAVLIEGAPGTGKSSLALTLIDRGAMLVGDDGVRLTARDGLLMAAPPPNTAGMIEIRNLGIARMEPCAAPVALAIMLDSAAPRFIEHAEQTQRVGVTVPLVRLWPESPVLALRAEWALRLYGLVLD
ncbi:MAG: HPr kinase/phosphatase C-terminal domain-containing protein [Novosphingobium sp.]|nr:HPr kinase/phosphatase C-terminal domain-containing protein [Novosphingobium sp.]